MRTSAIRRQTQRADELQPHDPTKDVLPEADLGDEPVLHEEKFKDDTNARAMLTSGENGSGDTGRNTLDNLRNTFPVTRRAATPPPGHRPWGSSVSYSSSQRHPMDTLERRGFASNTRDTSHGTARGDGASAADAASTITRLTVSLKRAQEEAARERERREECEEQARAAYASLEAESKRWASCAVTYTHPIRNLLCRGPAVFHFQPVLPVSSPSSTFDRIQIHIHIDLLLDSQIATPGRDVTAVPRPTSTTP